VIGSWVALFPGTLENWLGGSYTRSDSWTISRTEFEAFTLGTLAVFIVVALVGYVLGAPTRRQSVAISLEVEAALDASDEPQPEPTG
jgi:hypothetical protein